MRKILRCIVCIMLLGLMIAGCGAVPKGSTTGMPYSGDVPLQQYGGIQGYIRDRMGVAISFATVTVETAVVFTDLDGFYSFSPNFTQGVHRVFVDKEFYNRTYTDVVVPGMFNSATQNFTLYLSNPPVPVINNITPTSGSVNDQITVQGADFTGLRGTYKVTFFNNVNAVAYAQWTDTVIKVNIPAGASTGPVFVITDGGASNNWSFTVNQ